MFTVTELAERWRVSRATVLNGIRQQRITAIRTPGGHYRISEEEVRRFENEHNQEQEGLHVRGVPDGSG